VRRPKGRTGRGERFNDGVDVAAERSSHNLILGSSSPRRRARKDGRFWHATRYRVLHFAGMILARVAGRWTGGDRRAFEFRTACARRSGRHLGVGVKLGPGQKCRFSPPARTVSAGRVARRRKRVRRASPAGASRGWGACGGHRFSCCPRKRIGAPARERNPCKSSPRRNRDRSARGPPAAAGRPPAARRRPAA